MLSGGTSHSCPTTHWCAHPWASQFPGPAPAANLTRRVKAAPGQTLPRGGALRHPQTCFQEPGLASAGRSGRRPGLKELCPQGCGPAKAPSSHSTPGTPWQGLPSPSDCGPAASRGCHSPGPSAQSCSVLPFDRNGPREPCNKPPHRSGAGLLPRGPAGRSLVAAGAAQPLPCGCSCPNSCCDPGLCCEHELGRGTQSPRKPPGGRRVKAGGEQGESGTRRRALRGAAPRKTASDGQPNARDSRVLTPRQSWSL